MTGDGVELRIDEPRGRWVVAATVLGSALVFIDGTVVNVALPAIGRSLDTDVAGLAWIVNSYTLTLAAFILLGGALGDRFGRRRMFLVGVGWFAVASLLCGVAPGGGLLIAARALQGIGGALLTPGSLAILQSTFRADDRARAIGAWSGLSGLASAAGPLVGGWLVQAASWRWVFLVNLPIAAAVVAVTLRHVPESSASSTRTPLDLVGATVGAVGLGGLTYGLLQWDGHALSDVDVAVPLLVGLLALVAFLLRERTARDPMLPLAIFRSRVFSATNAVTFFVYAALGGVFFWLVLQLQIVSGFSPIDAGLALLPVTVLMLLLSARVGARAARSGPRALMTAGPLVCACSVALMTRIDADAGFLVDVLPVVTLFGVGLSLLVAPLTATVLAAVPGEHAGLASGVNNAVARAGSLLAVAALPLVTGLGSVGAGRPARLDDAFDTAMWVCAGLLLAGALLSAAFVRRPALAVAVDPDRMRHGCIDCPPLQNCPQADKSALTDESDGRLTSYR